MGEVPLDHSTIRLVSWRGAGGHHRPPRIARRPDRCCYRLFPSGQRGHRMPSIASSEQHACQQSSEYSTVTCCGVNTARCWSSTKQKHACPNGGAVRRPAQRQTQSKSADDRLASSVPAGRYDARFGRVGAIAAARADTPQPSSLGRVPDRTPGCHWRLLSLHARGRVGSGSRIKSIQDVPREPLAARPRTGLT